MAGEVATMSNGSLSKTRIVNMNRSQRALVTLYLKFGVDTPLEKVESLRRLVDAYVKERPQVRANNLADGKE